MASSSSSTSSSRKRLAMVVAIQYLRSKDKNKILSGACNDMYGMVKFLMEKRGFLTNEIMIFSDYRSVSMVVNGIRIQAPTVRNIFTALDKFVAKPSENPNLEHEMFFYFSGHGLSNFFISGKRINAFVDQDFKLIAAEDLQIRFDRLPKTVKLTVVLDTCYSGLMFEPPQHRQMNLTNDIRQSSEFRRVGEVPGRGEPRARMLTIEQVLDHLKIATGHPTGSETWFRTLASTINARFDPRDISIIFTGVYVPPHRRAYELILITACRSDEVAWEGYFGKSREGVFTHWFFEAIEKARKEGVPESNLLLAVQTSCLILTNEPSKCVQHPGLVCTKENSGRRFLDA